MDTLTLRDLHEISSEAIASLPGPTPVMSGADTIAILTPIKRPDPERLKAILREAEELSKRRDRAADDSALEAMRVDTTDWSFEAVRKFMAEQI